MAIQARLGKQAVSSHGVSAVRCRSLEQPTLAPRQCISAKADKALAQGQQLQSLPWLKAGKLTADQRSCPRVPAGLGRPVDQRGRSRWPGLEGTLTWPQGGSQRYEVGENRKGVADMAAPPVLDRLTAQDLFMLCSDDFGWSGDIGALAILDGAGCWTPTVRVRIDEVRRRLEPRLHLVPRFRQLLYRRPRRGLGWPLWIDAPASTSPTTSASSRWLPSGDQAQLLQACERSCGDGWTRPGRYGNLVAARPARPATGGPVVELITPSPTGCPGWRPSGRCWTWTPMRPPGRAAVDADPDPHPRRAAARQPAPAPGGSGTPGRAWPTRARSAGAATADVAGVLRRAVPPAPASTARSAPTAAWPSSAAAWSSSSRSPTPTRPRSTTWSWPPWPAACASCWPAVASPSSG